jgi:uncharacterized protein (TIGR02466 family)
MNHEVINLFALPVYKSNLQRGFTEAEMQFFKKELGNAVKAIANYSTRNKNVLHAEEMKDLRAAIQQNINTYFTIVHNTANPVTLEITQSWLSVTRRGESHHTHSHPNSVASGVLYINLTDNDGINFFRNDDLLWYDLTPKEQNYYNAYNVFVKAEMGDIIIFPSHVKHGVREVTDNFERVSLAFNTFFSGQLGRDDYANSLRVSVTPP